MSYENKIFEFSCPAPTDKSDVTCFTSDGLKNGIEEVARESFEAGKKKALAEVLELSDLYRRSENWPHSDLERSLHSKIREMAEANS